MLKEHLLNGVVAVAFGFGLVFDLELIMLGGYHIFLGCSRRAQSKEEGNVIVKIYPGLIYEWYAISAG